MIAGSDPGPWRLLADGTIVEITRAGDVVIIDVELQSICVKLLLAGCDAVKYEPHDEPTLYELPAIAASQPDIRDAVVENHAIVVNGGAGTLRLTYANLAIEVAGTRIELGELARRLT